MRNRLHREQGFTMIEVLVAVLILLIGIVATLGVFSTSKRTTLVAQRHEIAVHIAQREMEALRSLRYSELGLKVASGEAPAHSNDPNSPNYRVRASDGYFIVNPSDSSSTCCEEMVTTSSRNTSGNLDAPNGKVDPGGSQADPGEPFTVGSGSSAITGRIFRYVSWRDESCAVLICDGTHNTKRLIVGVSLNPAGSPRLGPLKPVWESSIASDPNEGPTSTSDPSPPPPPAPATSAQNFYLYAKACASSDTPPSNSYSAPTSDDATHNTASDVSSCENADSTRRPDLMGPVAPNYTGPVPPYKYSNDVGGDYPAGLAMMAKGSGCPTASYPLANANVNSGPSKWSVHAWGTKAFTQTFQVTGRVFLSLWTTSVGSTSGTGRFCATLVDRKIVGGVPNDIVLGSMSSQYFPWPTTKNEPGKSCGTADFPCGRQLSFSTTVAAATVRQGGRLMLILTALNTSEKDLVWLYDDPRYRSLIEIETSTPCNGTGNPCPSS
jgi:prepilin-type N-terminal cleavage/methylation domain-containing protein